MRPRELTIEGFRSYRDRVVFDLRGRRLVGVVGPIGSGKSSMLDAVTFALYGKTPAVESKTRSLIHQLADAAKVQLVFEVDGQIWRVQRAVRRKSAGLHKLERLAADEPGAAVLETIEQEKPTNERIATLLGLGFGAFCRSVMLAQNRFQEFLKATPTQRNEVLKGVFGYERFDRALALARERLAAAEATLAALEDEGRRLLDARGSLEEARAALDAVQVRQAGVEERWPAIEAATTAIAQGRTAGEDAAARLAAVDAVTDGLPGPEEVEAAIEGATAAGAAVEGATAILRHAEAVEAEALATRDAVAAAAEEDRAFHDLVGLLDARVAALTAAGERLVAAEASAESATVDAIEAAARASDAAVRSDEATAAREAAAAAREDAERVAHEARHAEMAVELRRHLRADEPCPVCEQRVANVPEPVAAPALAAAEGALAAAAAAAAAAAEEASRAVIAATDAAARAEAAVTAAVGATSAVEDARAATTVAEAEVAATRSELVDRLGEGDPRALLEERGRERREADAALTRAREDVAVARAELERLREAGVNADGELGRISHTITYAWGQLGERADVSPTPDDVRASASALDAAIRERRDAAIEAATAAIAAVDRATAALAAEREALGVAADEDLAEVRAAVRADAAAAAQRVATIEEAVGAAADLDERLQRAVEGRDLATRLTADLQPSRLLAFLLEEERAALAELGSVHLEELTGGAFRFADDDSFAIADQHAAGATRSPDSLSGGETFLASLALALALAEMVARGGGRLDAFFLDEGFGSLDPEHLDRAMEGIERLVAGDQGRLVVVVSHVEQMRQTIDDLIELDKDPRTGDTVVRHGASAAG